MTCLRLLCAVSWIILLAGCDRTPMQTGPMPHDVYVWQRAWNDHVREGLTTARGSMQTFVVFTGQITFGGDVPKIVKPTIDYAALAGLGRPIGLAIRVDPFPGPFAADDPTTRAIANL